MRRLLLLAVVSMVAAACGDDGGRDATPQQQAAIETLIADPLSGGEQRCLLEGLIQSGIDPIAVVEQTLDGGEDAALLAVTLECIDDLSRVPTFVDSFIEGAALEGVTLTDDEARCAIESLGTTDAATAIASCLDLPETGGPVTYGDDDVLDLLWDACDGGNNQVCDELWASAPPGTDYATTGRTCAGQLPDSSGGRCFLDLDS